jgi:hypothetical protein
MAYAWIIDRNHQPTTEPRPTPTPPTATARTGPGDAPDELVSLLRRGVAPEQTIGSLGIYRFELGTQDHTYYTGRLITDEGPTDAARYAPLTDFGLLKPDARSCATPATPNWTAPPATSPAAPP